MFPRIVPRPSSPQPSQPFPAWLLSLCPLASALALSMGCFTAGTSQAQTPFPVADIRTDSHLRSGYPQFASTGVETTPDGARMVYSWEDDDHGVEPWIVGATGAPELLADIFPGPASSWPEEFTAMGVWVYFRAEHPDYGVELWRAHQTTGVTELVADLLPGLASSEPEDLVASDGVLYFRAQNATQGVELWRTDGSAPPTIVDLVPGAGSSSPQDLVAGPDGGVYFSATTAASGREPWFSLGTPASSEPLDDLHPGAASSSPSDFTVLDADTVVFVATSPTLGRELVSWDEDTETATWHNISEADQSHSTNPRHLATIEDQPGGVIFSADTELQGREPYAWIAGLPQPQLLADLNPGPPSGIKFVGWIASGSDRVYFPAEDGSDGVELYSSKGSPAETGIVTDLASGSADSDPADPIFHDGILYFSAFEAALGRELRSTDGTGIDVHVSLSLGAGSVEPVPLAVAGDRLFARTGGFSFARLVRTPLVGGSFEYFQDWETSSSGIGELAAGREPGELYFSAETSAEGQEPWWIEADQPLAPSLMEDLDPGTGSSFPGSFTPAGSHVVFSASSSRTEPHIWDGNLTQVVDLIVPEDSAPADLAAFGGQVLLSAKDSSGDRQLWIVDPSVPSGQALTSTGEFVRKSSSFSASPSILVAGDVAFFVYEDAAEGREMWMTDGTPLGTGLATSVAPGSAFGVSHPEWAVLRDADGPVAPLIVFQGESFENGVELWVSDGTTAGTELLKDIEPGSMSSRPEEFFRSGDRALFQVPIGSQEGLWVTDGTSAGTTKLSSDHVPVPYLAALDGGWLFSGFSAPAGTEVWFTDGTVAGTQVLDILPGPGSSAPGGAVVVDGTAYFYAYTPENGRELWASDGTPGGTVQLPDILPGAAGQAGSLPLGASGEHLFFVANGMDGKGEELWAISVAPAETPLFADGFESGDTTAWQ